MNAHITYTCVQTYAYRDTHHIRIQTGTSTLVQGRFKEARWVLKKIIPGVIKK